MTSLRFLLLEDSEIDADLIQAVLHEGGLDQELIRVQTRADFLNALDQYAFDLILADYSLPSFDGISALEIAHGRCPEVPFIFVSGTLGEEVAVEMLKGGATDYVLKQRLRRLVPSVQRALQEAQERRARQQAEEQLQRYTRRLQLLSETSRSFSESILDFAGLLNLVCGNIGELLGDLCLLQILSEDDQWLQTGAVYHVRPDQAEQLNKIIALPPQPAAVGLTGQVLQSRQPLLLPLTTPTALSSEVGLETLSSLGTGEICSLMIVPLLVRDRSLGCLLLVRAAADRAFDAEDLAFVQDLADRAALAIDNARLYQKSQETNRLKDEFLAMLSHELRSPLNAMLGWLSLLRMRQFDQATAARALETVERNARTQARLVEDLLDVSRILQGKLRLNLQTLELRPILEAAVETVKPAAEAKHIQIEFSVGAAAARVSGDADRLQQVIWNLLSNATKFTPHGGRVELTLETVAGAAEVDWRRTLEAQAPNCGNPSPGPRHYAQITVKDTGQGISPEFLPHIFERFRQADSSITRSHGGLGLGLAIVQHLVELHGGAVSVFSEGVDQGATFTVKLPLMTVAPPSPGPTSAMASPEAEPNLPQPSDRQPPTAETPERLDGLKILGVDDEPDSRLLLISILEEHGAEVTAAASAAEAITLLTEADGPFDLLISDIGMPDEDGYGLLRQVRALKPEQGGQIPAIALTAYASEADRKTALAASFQAHVAKPIDPTELVELITHLQS